ncbi:hypothetical protein ABW21_db0203104 [Orbilia brochopaga]|nr:hypothetical protein ABW21_db0203104 [Drechslerella brochopaga]
MSTSASTNPFSPVRDENPVAYLACMTWLDALPYFALDEKVTLRAIINYTTNKNLLLQLPQLTTDEVRDLYELSLRALKNLRSWGGPKTSSTTSSPATSRIVSRAPSPPRTSASPPKPGAPRQLRVAVLTDGALPPTPPIVSKPIEPLGSHCLDVKLVWWSPAFFLQSHPSVRAEDPNEQCSIDSDGTIVVGLGPSRILRSGSIIRISTQDPQSLPLPSESLLWWHASIWQVIGSAGLSETITARERSKAVVSSRTEGPAAGPKRKHSPDDETGGGGGSSFGKPDDRKSDGGSGSAPKPKSDPGSPKRMRTRSSGKKAGMRDNELDIHSSAEYWHLWARKHLPYDLLAQYDVDPLEPEDDIA